MHNQSVTESRAPLQEMMEVVKIVLLFVTIDQDKSQGCKVKGLCKRNFKPFTSSFKLYSAIYSRLLANNLKFKTKVVTVMGKKNNTKNNPT